MSLIDRGSDSKPPEMTLDQKKIITKKQIEQRTFNAYKTLIETYNDLYTKVWENPMGLTPQQVFDELGTEGIELFKLSAILVETVNSAKPGTLSRAQPYEFTINPDGTVIVGNFK